MASWRLDRRDFLRTAATVVVSSTLVACYPPTPPATPAETPEARGRRARELFTFERSDTEVAVEVYVSERAGRPVSRYLYGKFTEHLGRNIYGGMWAQILENPGFEGWRYFIGAAIDWIDQRYRHYAELVGMPEMPKAREAISRGITPWWLDRNIAPWWLAYGSGDVVYELDPEAFNSDTAQKIAVDTLETQEVGIWQAIYLPLHREKDYDLSFYARCDRPCRLHIAIRDAANEDHVLAEGDVEIATQEWRRYALKLTIDEEVERGALLMFTVGLLQPGTVWLDQMTLFPEDNVEGFDADVVRLTRESRLSILRWPGGNFASGYHWKDGIGPVEERETTLNEPWDMIEYNHVGTDEFIAFCRAVGADPLIVVNAGNGTPEEAAEWVEYCNGGVNTKYGALRAKNGHPEPYNVVYWEIGNELWGTWQIGHTTPEEYAKRYRRFYEAMTAVDPAIKAIANGQDRSWNGPIIRQDADILRSLSIHTLIGGGTPESADPTKVFMSLMAYTYYYADLLRDLAAQMAEGVAEPKFAVTELQIFTNQPNLPNNQTLSEALFWSGIVNTCIRLGDLVELITHSALVNHGGGLRKVREIVYPNPVYYARKLYATQSGTIPVRIHVRSPTFDASSSHVSIREVPYLDAIALIDDDDRELNLILTNRHPERALEARIALHDFDPTEIVRVQTLTGESFMSQNTWDEPDEVTLRESSLRIDGASLSCSVPAHSIVLLTFGRKKG